MRAFPSRCRLGLSLALAGLLPLSVPAQQESDPMALTEDYFLAEVPMVLSASRLAQPVSESPAAMTIIDRRTIEASGAIDIPDVLRLVPGFQVSHISGQNQTAQYHGLANQHPKRMQVLIDGRSVYHSAFGGVHWDTLPITLDDIERIEVLRGPNAAAYGSNAFMGVVNIVTRHASQVRGPAFGLLAGYGRTAEATARFGDRLGRLDYRITLDAFTTDGFPDYRGRHIYWDTTGMVPPAGVVSGTPLMPETGIYTIARDDSQQIGRLHLRGDYPMRNGDQLLFELGHVRNDRANTIGNGDYGKLVPDERLRTNFELVKWSRTLEDLDEISIQLSHNRLEIDNRHTDILIERLDPDGAGPTPTLLLNAGPTLGGYQIRNDQLDLEIEHRTSLADLRIAWGGGIRLDTIDGTNFLVDDKRRDRWLYRLFANADRYLDKENRWIANAGATLEHQSDQGSFISPRLALNFHLDDFNTLRVAASRAYRMPSFHEQYGEQQLFFQDPSSLAPVLSGIPPFRYLASSSRWFSVDPERLETLELGLTSINWQAGVSLDVRLFKETLDDYIDEVRHENRCAHVTCDDAPALVAGHYVYTMENTGWLDMHGIDFQLDAELAADTRLLASGSLIRAKGSRIKEIDDDTGQVTQTANTGEYVPKWTFSALLSHRFDHDWDGSVAYYRMSEMNWPNEGDRIKPYDRLDVRLAKRVQLGDAKARIELIGQNVRNQEYAEFRYDNRFERRIYLRMRMELP